MKNNKKSIIVQNHEENTVTDFYKYAFNYFRKKGVVADSKQISQYINQNSLELISQVEFQPGCHCDLYRCPHCYGNGQTLMEGNLELRHYVRVLDEINGKVPLIQISGVKTEPLTSPIISEIICEIKKRDFGCGFHTKGYRLDSKIIELLTEDVKDKEAFITFSIDANESNEYINTHDIDLSRKDASGNRAEDYFKIVVDNIKKLWEKRESKNSKLRINIALLLFDENNSIEKLNKFIDLFGKYSDVIRFSIPQNTNSGVGTNLISEKTQLIKSLIRNFKDNRKVKILTAIDTDHNTFFNKCYAQLLQAVIDKAGNVFPCPQTALKEYSHLIYGNIKESRFSDIIHSQQKKIMKDLDVDKELGCRICDRKDEDINIFIDRLL